MANLITAINAYRPKLVLGSTVKMKELVEYISGRTGLNKGDLQITLSELSGAVIFFNKRGQGVKLDGLGTYLPSIDTKGELSISHRLDADIKNTLNAKGAYLGEIQFRDNIGKTNEEFTAMWNKDHPGDLVV
jgi:hypothetical protein